MNAIAAGSDGLIMEVHYSPETALCDGQQSLSPDEFGILMVDGRSVLEWRSVFEWSAILFG